MEPVADAGNRIAVGANPLPLGFAALGISVALWGTYMAGHAHTLALVGLPLLVGGLIQVISAILAFVNRDTEGLMIFGVYGALSVILGVLVLATANGGRALSLLSGSGTPWLYFVFAVLAAYIWIASMRVSGAVALTMLLVGAMFATLWIGSFSGGTPGTGWIEASGWLGWAAAIAAGYTSFAELINTTFGRIVLPEFPIARLQTMPQ